MDEKIFTDIIEETRPVVLGAIGRHLYPRFYHAIDDVAQETYMRAYRSLMRKNFRGDSKISTWLYTIARNESLRMNSKLSREEEKLMLSSEMLLLEGATDISENSLSAEELREMIKGLPLIYREVLELASAGLTEKEISRQLNIKSGTVKSRASRGREILRKTYGGQEHE